MLLLLPKKFNNYEELGHLLVCAAHRKNAGSQSAYKRQNKIKD